MYVRPALVLTTIHLAVVWLVSLVTLALWHPRAHPLFGRWERVPELVGEHVLGIEALLRAGRWDASWYLEIAANGYAASESFAFLPLFPLLVGVLGEVGVPLTVAAFAISVAATWAATWAILRLGVELQLPSHARTIGAGLLVLLPPAVVLTAGYPEALLVAAVAGTWLAALRSRGWLAAMAAGLAMLTKPLGVVAVPLLWVGTASWRRKLGRTAAALGVAAVWPLTLALRRSSPLAPVEAQGHWDRAWHPHGPPGALWDAFAAAGRGVREIFSAPVLTGGPVPDVPVHLDELAVGVQNVVNLVVWLLLAAALPACLRQFGTAPAASLLIVVLMPLTAPVVGGDSVDVPLWSMPRFALVAVPALLLLATWLTSQPRRGLLAAAVGLPLFGLAAAGFAAWQWLGWW